MLNVSDTISRLCTIATFIILDLQTIVHTQCVQTLMIYPHTKFCVPNSTDSLVIAMRPKATEGVCTAVTVLFHWYRTVILINMHIAPRPINTYNFRALKCVALVSILDHKLICLPHYNCTLQAINLWLCGVLQWHEVHPKFHENQLMVSQFKWRTDMDGRTDGRTDTHTHTPDRTVILSLLLSLFKEESKLKILQCRS